MSFLKQMFFGAFLLMSFDVTYAVCLDTYKDVSNPGFQLTLRSDVEPGEGPVWPSFDQAYYMKGFLKAPHVGHYDASGNYLSPTYALIQHSHCLYEVLDASPSLRRPIDELIHVQDEEQLFDTFDRVECYVIVSGRPKRFEEENFTLRLYEGLQYNVMLHPWAMGHYGPSKKIKAGLFEPVGVSPAREASMPFGAYAMQEVYLHPAGSESVPAWSPDNMRFNVEGKISAFWVLAEYENRPLLVYQIMIADEEMEKTFEELSNSSMTLREWLDSVNSALINVDDKALAVIETLKKLFPEK